MKLIKYYIYLFISRLLQNSANYVKQYNFEKLATFDETVSISGSSNISNPQNDKSKIIIGKNSIVHGSLLVFGFGGEIVIGESSFIGPNSNIWLGKSIRIGS